MRTTTQAMSSLLPRSTAASTSFTAAFRASRVLLTSSTTSWLDITFQSPSLATTTNSVSSPTCSMATSGSELMCSLSFRSPNARDIASDASTRGTSPDQFIHTMHLGNEASPALDGVALPKRLVVHGELPRPAALAHDGAGVPHVCHHQGLPVEEDDRHRRGPAAAWPYYLLAVGGHLLLLEHLPVGAVVGAPYRPHGVLPEVWLAEDVVEEVVPEVGGDVGARVAVEDAEEAHLVAVVQAPELGHVAVLHAVRHLALHQVEAVGYLPRRRLALASPRGAHRLLLGAMEAVVLVSNLETFRCTCTEAIFALQGIE
ncbi:hypothetical protein CFC21_016565 [Triticum aestivum]|uniref:Uncharacterized protein n=1 Tax=Triticum aestivum TaxID=4565 RepID=A0A9R1J1R6_WHEAT|nr:hypothetical protein CFC21_016565 [Triticum aestivum]